MSKTSRWMSQVLNKDYAATQSKLPAFIQSGSKVMKGTGTNVPEDKNAAKTFIVGESIVGEEDVIR